LDQLPPSVRGFLAAYIVSIEQLETLLLVQREPERWWSAEMVAAELRSSTGASAERLEEMASKNLLDVRISDDLFYRYAPVSPSLAEAVLETARAYKESPVAVTTVIYSRSLDEIRGFAEAFRIRKRREEGTDG